ncbi:MAG: secretin N-terminal domain-containing protein, partial [Verrucomicrobiota bacterium]
QLPNRTASVQLTRIFRPRASEVTNVASILTQALSRRSPNGANATTASVSVDQGSQSVVVSGTANDVQIASDIVSQLETGSSLPVPFQTRFIDLGSPDDAKRLLPLVEQLYRNQAAGTQGASVAHAKILQDPDSGRLIVTASEEHLARIEGIVRQLRTDRPEALPRKLKVFPLVHTRPDAALPSIQNLLNERLADRRLASPTKPSLVADSPNNRLLVTATDDQLREIEAIIAIVDAAPDAPRRDLVFIPLSTKSASEILPLVNQLLPQLKSPNAEPPTLLPDPTGKQLIVLAASNDLPRIRALVAQFDQSNAAAAPRQFKSLQPGSRPAADVAPLLQQLYAEQIKGLPEPLGGPASVLADPRQNRLMVSGPEKEIARVESILAQLEPANSKATRDETRVFKLRAASANDLSALVEKSLGASGRAVRVLLDARSNSLVVSGDPDALQAAAQIIQQLDARPDAAPRDFRIFDLKSSDANSLAPTLNSLLAEMLRDQRGADFIPLSKITPDTAGNRILVTGPREEIEQVASLVNRLDNAPQQAPGARVFKLSQSDASMLAPIVSSALLRYDARGNPIRRVTVTADDKSNSLVVSGTRADLQDAESVIEKLDNEAGGSASSASSRDRILRILDVKSDPDAVASFATKAFAPQNSRAPNPVSITPDPAGKRLVVLAPATLMPQVEQVVSSLDTKPEQASRELHTVELKSANASDFLPRVQQIYAEQSKGKTLQPATLYADASNQRLLVLGTSEQAAAIRQIAETVATAPRQPRETKAFDVGSTADAQRLLPVVQQLYSNQWKDRAESDPADASIVADPRTGRLIITGKPDHLRQIEAILNQLNPNPTPGAKPSASTRETRILDLTTATAAELVSTVRTLYLEEAKARLGSIVPDTLITPDAGANRLILVGDTNELAAVESIVSKLDKTSSQSASARVFKIKSAEPAKVAEILSTALVRFDAYGRPQKRTSVSVDSKTRTLIVTGDPKELQGVSLIIEQLDQSLGTQEGRSMKVLSLAQGRAASLVPKLRQLLADRIKSQPELGTDETLILEEPDSNQLILAGSPAQLAAVEQIVNDLQAAQGAQAARDTRFFDLGSASELERLQPLVQQLYRIRSTNNPSDRPDAVFVPDTKNARLIVTARTNHLAEISRILTQLQGDQAERAPRETRVIDLTTANAAELSSTVRTLYQEQAKSRPGAPAADTLILPDNGANRLIVTATTNELALVEDIIRKLDKISAQSASTRVVKLKSADPAKVAEILSSALVRYDAFGRPQKRVSVSVDAKTRTLITTGDPKELQSASVIIEQLDQSLGDDANRSMRVVSLQSRRAADVSSKVRQVFQDQSRSNPALGNGEALILDDPASNQLVLAGTEPQLKAIASIIEAFDTPEAGSNAVLQSVRITKGRADDIANAVNRSLTNRPGYNPATRVVITPVPGANSILLNGPTNAVQDVLRIVRELDADAPSSEIEVRIYKLENGNAKEVSTILTPILQSVSNRRRFARASQDGGDASSGGGGFARQATVSIDDRSNSLVVTGTADHFAVIEKLLPTLDKAPDRTDRDVQFVWLRKGRAFDVASQIEATFANRPKAERPIVEPDLSNNSLTLIGRRADLAQIQELVSRLDAQGKDSSYVVRLRALDRVAADQMAKLLEGIYPQTTQSSLSIVEKVQPRPDGDTNAPPGVSVAIDKQANALVLAGPVAEIENVERLISELSFNFYGNEAEFRLFPLKDADPVLVAKTLTEVFKPEPIQLTPAQLRQLSDGVPPQQPPKITVVAEPRTRSVVIRARPTDFGLLESLIKQLDAAGATAQTSFKVFPLAHAEPQKALILVQQMVAQLNATRPGDPVTVSVSPRDRGLLVVARDPVIQQVSKMIESIDQPSKNVEADVRVFPLKRANATQLANILQNLLRPGPQGESTPEARELQEQVRRLNVRSADGSPVTLDLSQPIRISADAAPGGGNRLLVTASSSNLEALASVIDLLDTPAIVEGVRVRFVRLAHADAASTATTLTTLFSQGRTLATGPAGPGAEPQSDAGKALAHPLTVAIDARSNTLILSGQPDTLELAAKVVADIDQPLERFVTDIRLFRLKHASASRLLPLLRSVFTEGPSVPGTEGLATQVTRLRTLRDGGDASKSSQTAKSRAALTLQADDISNILLVAARTDMLPLIEDVVNQLDIPAASGLETVRVYPLQHADPASIQKILSDLFTGPRSTTLRDEDKPIVSLDPRTASLIVAGNSKAFAILDSLLAKLDQKLDFDLRDIQLVPLQHADASLVATTLQRLMDARISQRALRTPGAADSLKVVILADTRSNALLVGGSREGFELVQSLAKQLDDASPALAGRIRIVPVENADARVLASTLNALFTQRYAALPGTDLQRQRPIILPDTRANVLLVAASQDDNATLDDLLSKLDQKLENPALALVVIPLRNNDAARVANLIEASFTARLRAQTLPGQPPLPSQQVDVQPDPLNNALVVSASKENLELIQSLVAKLDAQPAIPGGVFEMFTLQFADAQRVATVLRSLVDQGLYRPGLPPNANPNARTPQNILSTSVDTRSNTLIVSASPENLAIVKSVIEKLDSKDVAAASDVRLYPLRHARASSLAPILDQFFRAKRTADAITVNANERILPVTILADDRVNALLVSGGKEAFDLVDRLLPQLDGEGSFARLNFRVFPLQKATAAKLQQTLQAIVANRPPKVKGEPIDPITIVADNWVNALLVGATVDDMDTVASLVRQLDAEPTDTGLSIHVFPLAKADARRVATTVQGLFRDAGPNQVLPVVINADERINALVVSCGEIDARRIGELVRQLDTDQVARVSEIKVFPLDHARAETLSAILTAALNSKPTPLTDQNPNAQSVLQFISRTEDGQELVSAALKEGILITPDPRMNSLVVSGPVEYMGLLEQIIHRLDAASPQQAKIKVFSLQNADARQMGELLTQLFRMTQTTTASQRSIQYTLVRSRTAPDGSPTPDDEPLASATL